MTAAAAFPPYQPSPGYPRLPRFSILRMMGLDEPAATALPSGAARAADDDAVRASHGDRDALERLLRAHASAIAHVCHAMSPPGDGRDATQAALERIVRRIHQLDPTRGEFRSWAFQVARNVCRDRARRRKHRPSAPEIELPGNEPDPERLADARERAARVDGALGSLPEGMRQALIAYHLDGRSYAEIAAQLDVPPGTVMTWLHRGRRRLRDLVEGPGSGETGR